MTAPSSSSPAAASPPDAAQHRLRRILGDPVHPECSANVVGAWGLRWDHERYAVSDVPRGRAVRRRAHPRGRAGAPQTDVCARVPDLRRDAVGATRRRPRLGARPDPDRPLLAARLGRPVPPSDGRPARARRTRRPGDRRRRQPDRCGQHRRLQHPRPDPRGPSRCGQRCAHPHPVRHPVVGERCSRSGRSARSRARSCSTRRCSTTRRSRCCRTTAASASRRSARRQEVLHPAQPRLAHRRRFGRGGGRLVRDERASRRGAREGAERDPDLATMRPRSLQPRWRRHQPAGGCSSGWCAASSTTRTSSTEAALARRPSRRRSSNACDEQDHVIEVGATRVATRPATHPDPFR